MKKGVLILLLLIPVVNAFDGLELIEHYNLTGYTYYKGDSIKGFAVTDDFFFILRGYDLYKYDNNGDFLETIPLLKQRRYIDDQVYPYEITSDGENVYLYGSESGLWSEFGTKYFLYKLLNNDTFKIEYPIYPDFDDYHPTPHNRKGMDYVDSVFFMVYEKPTYVDVYSNGIPIKNYTFSYEFYPKGIAAFDYEDDNKYFIISSGKEFKIINNSNVLDYDYENQVDYELGFSSPYNGDSVHDLQAKDNLLYVLELNRYQWTVGGYTGPRYDPQIYVYDLNYSSDEIINEDIFDIDKIIQVLLSNITRTVLINPDSNFTLDNYNFGKLGNVLKYNLEYASMPYAGIVANVDNVIYIYSNSVYGTLTSIKFLLENKEKFDNNFIYLINDRDNQGLIIYDYLIHTNLSNKTIYRVFSELYEKEIYYVNDLELIRYNPLISDKLGEFNGNPVVLARGLWSNVYTWQDFAEELASNGKEVYLIGLTGSEAMECDGCDDYEYDYLVENVLPSYVDRIKEISDSDEIDYVGFSNGARVALDSNISFDNLILIAAPGAFEGFSPAGEIIKNDEGKAIVAFEGENKSHFTILELVDELFNLTRITTEESKISLNLFEYYEDLISNNEDEQPGENTKANDFVIIQGNKYITSDILVTTDDEKAIYDNLQANKKYFNVFADHLSIADRFDTKFLIMKLLEKEELSKLDKLIYLKEENNI